MHDCISNNKIKENKYKILRMSLILGSDDDRTETLNNFEESAREIDAMNDEIYLKDLEDKFYDTLKLEEEEEKLAVLVDYIGGRVEQRISLLSDFANITGYDLSNLPPIKYYDKLDDYKERLKYIREYLGNTEQINILTVEIEEAETKLKEAYLSKATSEECNSRNEEIILNKFKNIIRGIPEIKDVAEENIDIRLNEILNSVKESKKSLDIFSKSYTTLRSSGISYDEEQEYKSYVENAKDLYYKNKEQEYLLKIYQHLLIKETEYSGILDKRQQINSLLYERLDLRRDLGIDGTDALVPLYDLLEKQYNEIETQRETIQNIELLNKEIESKKEQLSELEQDNQKVEILALLREFCIIDTYIDNELDVEIPQDETDDSTGSYLANEIPTSEETTNEEVIDSLNQDSLFTQEPLSVSIDFPTPIADTPKDNEIINIENATKIDLDLIYSKANKVMKRVGEMLGIKTEETKIVNVTNEPEPVPPISQKELPQVETTASKEMIINPLPEENPLFSNNITESLPDETTATTTEENSFWFPSDTPDALNELPDLEISTDNFNNNIMPDLNFPDLKLDFGNNDSEEK